MKCNMAICIASLAATSGMLSRIPKYYQYYYSDVLLLFSIIDVTLFICKWLLQTTLTYFLQ